MAYSIREEYDFPPAAFPDNMRQETPAQKLRCLEMVEEWVDEFKDWKAP